MRVAQDGTYRRADGTLWRVQPAANECALYRGWVLLVCTLSTLDGVSSVATLVLLARGDAWVAFWLAASLQGVSSCCAGVCAVPAVHDTRQDSVGVLCTALPLSFFKLGAPPAFRAAATFARRRQEISD